MKIRFKSQPHQGAAVQAVLDCFRGQPAASGFSNRGLALEDGALLDNIRDVQRRHDLPQSPALVSTEVCRINLDIEMETGTGKTYCYIKTIFELNRCYGWNKFIIVVPSIAIREGVARSLAMTAEHFLDSHGKKARFFVYSSRQPHQLESFAADGGIGVMVINVQAFNATGKDARRIYEEQDEFGSRRPIDVVAATRPILILDEPQKMEGDKTLGSLRHFDPLMVLRYSATHKTGHNKIFRLDALDAYNRKLVKRIAVRGIAVRGIAGVNGYLYLQAVEVASGRPPVARVEFEQKRRDGTVSRVVRRLDQGDDLYAVSNGLEQYRGYRVAAVDAHAGTLSFANGVELAAGDAVGDVGEAALRRIQIREAVRAHFDRERLLFGQGVKVLTLFFIDQVARYRDYAADDEKGEYARMFEEEYALYLGELLAREQGAYRAYLEGIDVARTHAGYFSIDRKSRRMVDPEPGRKASEADDAQAYDLILKDKERLLSLDEPVRFIFSHSALREGWDNPNVFVICALKHSDNSVSRRQEVGRGLRLAVNQSGERIDDPDTVHEVNVLTVVASESYKDFVAALQKDIGESLAARPRGGGRDDLVVVPIDDGRRSPVTSNESAGKRAPPAASGVRFDPRVLHENAVRALDQHLHVAPLQYLIEHGEQAVQVSHEALAQGASFVLRGSSTQRSGTVPGAATAYDLIGTVAAGTLLTRAEVAGILSAIRPGVFALFAANPEHFITQATRLINEQKAALAAPAPLACSCPKRAPASSQVRHNGLSLTANGRRNMASEQEDQQGAQGNKQSQGDTLASAGAQPVQGQQRPTGSDIAGAGGGTDAGAGAKMAGGQGGPGGAGLRATDAQDMPGTPGGSPQAGAGSPAAGAVGGTGLGSSATADDTRGGTGTTTGSATSVAGGDPSGGNTSAPGDRSGTKQ